MKPSILLSVIVLALVVSAQTFAQAPRATPSQDVRAEFDLLKREVSRLKQEVTALKDAQGPKPEEFEAVVAYLNAQAESASYLKQVLVESEEKGFTYGINPDSRIVLLAGFEHFATTLETPVFASETDTEE